MRSREHQAASHSINEAMCAGRVAPGVLPDLLRHPKNLSASHHSRAIQSHSLIPPRSRSSKKFITRDPEGSNRTPRHTFFTRALLNAIVTGNAPSHCSQCPTLFGTPRDLETITADLETMTADSETMIRKLRHVIWKLTMCRKP